MHIECPQCRNPIEIVESEAAHEIACPSCGSCVLTSDLQATRTFGETPPISKLGRYELVEKIGQGAFGSVWRARDPELGTERAVKLPRSGSIGNRADEERFLREARVAANLKHPSIVTVHDIGRQDDTLYIVADLVRGVNLAEWLSGQRPDLRESATLVAEIADALHYAHDQGVVHRDLKPSNIMLEFPSPHAGDGSAPMRRYRPVLMDFGLAKRDAVEITMTREGSVLGTPA
jgi:serine/threonine protein kinase